MAVSGPLSDDRHGVVVRVAEEREFSLAELQGRRPVSLAWPLGLIEIEGQNRR